MSVFNKRNAAVGYVTLKVASRALDRRRRRRKRSGLKLALYVVAGLVSLGVLAALIAVLLRRHNGESQGSEEDEDESEVVGEYVRATPEPIPAA